MGPLDREHLTTPMLLVGIDEKPEPVSSIEPLISTLAYRHPGLDTAIVRRGFALASRAHEGQRRLSGEPYITHSIAVAQIVADLGLDATSVVAALLHDVVEDTAVTVAEIESEFGSVVAEIVDGVTKLDRLKFSSREAQQAATVRKMLVAMANDWRVLVIKLADRLHNMRTLSVMPDWKQRRIAQQTLDIYAPLAHRLGIQEIKWQLEDLSFFTLHPKRYEEIAQMVATRAPSRELEVAEVVEVLKARLEALGIEAIVTGRPKHLWSIYEKMVVRGKEFEEINDLVGIRVIVDSDKDCWEALGTVHALWPPVQGRFKDYINSPKFNLYQSLHTTVVGPRGKPLEVQIRTMAMHLRAEHGIAAHWGYKEDAAHPGEASSSDEIQWLQRIVDWERETPDPIEFLETLKLDLEQDEVYVFTPKGEIITLPTGSTPIDFAYAIHTDVGHRCVGARVNEKLVPIETKLQSGDTVEIITSKFATAGPSNDWLKIVVSPKARNKIRQWFSRERREDAIDNGRDDLAKELRREGLPVRRLFDSSALERLASVLGYADLEGLYAAIGEGHLSARAVVQRLRREILGEGEEQLPTTVLQPRRSAVGESTSAGVFVEGLDDMLVRLSACCTPVPGDPIVGFVTRGRGVSVHRADCVNALSLAGEHRERLVEVEWDAAQVGLHTASIGVKALDRSELLADVARVLAEHHVGIVAVSAETAPDRVTSMRFECELADSAHLDSVLASLRGLEGVYDAFRLLPGKGRSFRAANS
ncbi:MAG: bifunctional (p)ppGpp synthetase/guanosine-3',5'-bis(diphosphate) 3'-pyrophosphohydrolase [Acidimicrobiales bacterium]